MYERPWRAFWSCLVLAVLAAALLVGAAYSERINGWIVFLTCAGIVLAIGAIFKFSEWLSEVLLERYHQKQDADAVTPESRFVEQQTKLADKLKNLDDDRVKLLGAQSLLGIDNGMDAEQYVRGTNVPMWFAYDFLIHSNDKNLVPRSQYGGTETTKYKMADELTRLFARFGYADDPHSTSSQWVGGNQPATWTRSGLRNHFLHAWFDDEYLHDDDDPRDNGRDAGHVPPSPTTSTSHNLVN